MYVCKRYQNEFALERCSNLESGRTHIRKVYLLTSTESFLKGGNSTDIISF